MVKYENGKIYRLVCNITGLQYIGSTCSSLSHRKNGHRDAYKFYTEMDNKKYVSSFEVLKGGDYDIVLIENYPCNDKNELHARERFYIETMDCVNKRVPSRSKKEYNDINKDKKMEYNKQYYEKNKEVVNKKFQDYLSQNREKVNNRKKEHYEENKERLLEEKKVKVVCECGTSICKDKLQRHKRTLKHKKILSNIN